MLKFAVSTCIVLGLGIGAAHAADAGCQATSSRMLDHLDKSDYSGATADFNDRMKASLDAARLAKLWSGLAQQFGARGTREQGRQSEVNGYTVVLTTVHYGPHLIDARVVCDTTGKVAGFFVKPLD
jgi:hypothetical protein